MNTNLPLTRRDWLTRVGMGFGALGLADLLNRQNLLEASPAASPLAVKQPHFPVFREFENASYADRYELLIRKLLRDRLYDGACLLLSESAGGRRGEYSEPDSELTFSRFVAPLVAHCAARFGRRAK